MPYNKYMTEENGGKEVNKIVLWLQKYWFVFVVLISSVVWVVSVNVSVADNRNDIKDIQSLLQDHFKAQIDAEKNTAAALSRIEGALKIQQ